MTHGRSEGDRQRLAPSNGLGSKFIQPSGFGFGLNQPRLTKHVTTETTRQVDQPSGRSIHDAGWSLAFAQTVDKIGKPKEKWLANSTFRSSMSGQTQWAMYVSIS
jgi:hypothetical protein